MDKTESQRVSVLFVCLGNICRSPSSEGIFRNLVRQENLESNIRIDSAGTAGYHVGYPPDRRAIAAAARRGVDITDLKARKISRLDFNEFNYMIGMDYQNYEDLESIKPLDYHGQVCLFMDFASSWEEREVPDPYYGGDNGFERVLDMIEDASAGLIEEIKNREGRN